MKEYPDIQKLITYVEGLGDTADQPADRIQPNHEPPPRRIAAIHLLQWLLNRAEQGDRRPLEIHPTTAWRIESQDLIGSSRDLSRLLTITEKGIDFKPEISENERRDVEQFVSERFSPPFFDA